MRALSLAAALGFMVVVGGCFSTGRDFDENRVTEIQKGTSTEADVIKMFGAPQSRSKNSDGSSTLTWSFGSVRTTPIVGAFGVGNSQSYKTLMVTCDPQGVVKDYSVNTSNM